MDTKQFQRQVEAMWSTRPVRLDDSRTIAGVCGGIGARYRVDTTLIKIAFVVAALFGGSGLVLYLAAWIALPGSASTRSGVRSRRPHPTGHSSKQLRNPRFIVFVVLVIVIITSFGPSRTWGSGGLAGAILMVAGWWLLHLRTPTPPPGTSVDTAPTTPLTAAMTTTGHFERWIPRAMLTPPIPGFHPPAVQPADGRAGAGMVAAADATTTATPSTTDAPAADALTTDALMIEPRPPSWDPLGTAPFAWDLPEPAQPVFEPPRDRRSPLTLVMLGAAVIVGAAGAAAHQAGVDWFTTAHVLALALAVIGVGLVHAGLRRRSAGRHSTGLVPIAIVLGIATVAVTGFTGIPGGGVGERNWKPLTENDIKGGYELGMGSMVLDLRDIDLTADRHVSLRNGVGEIKVRVGRDMNVRTNCSTQVGDYQCPEGLDGGTDGTAGPVLTIDAHSGIGHVEVTR